MRVALYIRVSGEEQKIKGLSLEAQQERLEAYAREHGWMIVGVFVDAAKTARKNIHKRTEFLRMMDLVKRDGVDLLLFCRLDRWFLSVRPEVCLQLLSDSVSRRTPLLFSHVLRRCLRTLGAFTRQSAPMLGKQKQIIIKHYHLLK